MPALVLATNVPRASIPDGFLKEASEMFQKAIGKPMQYISVSVVPDQLMCFGGTEDPCALITVTSIGKLGVEENKVISGTIFGFIGDKLNIPDTRAYIEFVNKPPSDIGYQRTTFHK